MSGNARHRRVATGIRRRVNGTLEAYIEVKGVARSKVFPARTPIAKIQIWRLQQRTLIRPPRTRTGGPGTLDGDIEEHLAARQNEPTFRDRKRILKLWSTELGGDRPRSSIERKEIELIVSRWLERGLSPGTIEVRLSTLQALWNWIEGPEGPNPVRAVRRPRRDPVQARGLAPDQVQALLEALPDGPVRTICEVMAWTGLAHQQIRELQPSDIRWESGELRTRGRRKGKQAPARIVPLLEKGLEALREFDSQNLYGYVPNQEIWIAVKRAGYAIGEPNVRPYDLRHSFATLMYEGTGDLSATSYLLGHSSIKTTLRYAMNAIPRVARSAIENANRKLEPAGLVKRRRQSDRRTAREA